MNSALREELLGLLRHDYLAANRITDHGARLTCNNPDVAAVIEELRQLNTKSAARLTAIVGQYGWPSVTLVGQDGALAMFRLVLHCFTLPDFQRSMLRRLEEAATEGAASWSDFAVLEDRIRALEGRPQKFGTQFRWDENGHQVPEPPVENAHHVDEVRAAVGLRPLEEEAASRTEALRAVRQRVTEEETSELRERAHFLARLLGWR
jgi:uncharacterized protein DUF6624